MHSASQPVELYRDHFPATDTRFALDRLFSAFALKVKAPCFIKRKMVRLEAFSGATRAKIHNPICFNRFRIVQSDRRRLRNMKDWFSFDHVKFFSSEALVGPLCKPIIIIIICPLIVLG